MPVEIYSALLGVFVGGFITYYFAFKLAIAQNRIAASANFRAAFSYTISQMAIAQIDKSIDKETLLTGTFHNLSTAVETYRPFIPCKDREAYQDAWQKYYMPDGIIAFHDYCMKITGPDGIESKPYEIFNHRINSILEFAKL